MRTLDILIPTAGRQQRLLPLMDSIRRTTPVGQYMVTLVADKDDDETVRVVRSSLAGMDVQLVAKSGTFPEKVNAAVRVTDAPYMVVCGNDVLFHQDWFAEAEKFKGRGVIGTNDLTPRTRARDHATAQIVSREYVEDPGAAWREPGHVFHEGYHHNYADNELCAVARFRDEWVFADCCVIEHFHPAWGTAEDDAVYAKGLEHYHEDRRLFRKRRRLWIQSQSA